jgi:dihydroneopterin aldolase
MTLMLASVAGPAEAAVALEGGADVIDLKDPARGAFGAVAPAVVRDTVALLRGRRRVSAVAGEVAFTPDSLLPAVTALAETGVEWVKIGLTEGDVAATLAALRPPAARVKLVAVLFADRAPDFDLLPALAAAGFAGAMLDTAGKNGGRLLAQCDLPRLARFAALCRDSGLFCGLAGGLEPPDIPRLLPLDPFLLGFRGALCAAGRAGPIAADCVRRVRALIPPETGAAWRGGVDWRVLARGHAPDAESDIAAADRVFLRGLVLDVRIGAYAHEHARPQRVRFDVTVAVARPREGGRLRPLSDLGDIYSYDIISDGIRLLVAEGHVDLVETLAERIAARLLADARVLQAEVQVTKLQTGQGRVGVALTRTRATLPAALLPLSGPVAAA